MPACTFILQILRVLTASEKITIIGLWEWLIVGVVIMNDRTTDVKPGRAVLAAVMEVSVTL